MYFLNAIKKIICDLKQTIHLYKLFKQTNKPKGFFEIFDSHQRIHDFQFKLWSMVL